MKRTGRILLVALCVSTVMLSACKGPKDGNVSDSSQQSQAVSAFTSTQDVIPSSSMGRASSASSTSSGRVQSRAPQTASSRASSNAASSKNKASSDGSSSLQTAKPPSPNFKGGGCNGSLGYNQNAFCNGYFYYAAPGQGRNHFIFRRPSQSDTYIMVPYEMPYNIFFTDRCVYFVDNGIIYENVLGNASNRTRIAAGFLIGVEKEWVYYCDGQFNISRIRTNGTGQALLLKDPFDDETKKALSKTFTQRYIKLYNGSVYYKTDRGLFKYSVKENAITEIANQKFGALDDFIIIDEAVYYSTEQECYKYQNGKTSPATRDMMAGYVANGWVYQYDSTGIYCHKIGMLDQKDRFYIIGNDIIGKNQLSWIGVCDGWLYFEKNTSEYALYKIRVDGKDFQQVKMPK